MKFRFTLSLILILLSSAVLFAQQKPDIEGKAIVYVYSLRHPKTLGRLRPSIYLDNQEIARIYQQRYFIAVIEPGKHEIHFKKSKQLGGISMNFEANKTYYLRVNWQMGVTIHPQGFDLIAQESANYDIENSKPIDEKEIIKKDLVFLALPK